jgi:intracellular sulfur oxidation DsrE/DsrF family protein
MTQEQYEKIIDTIKEVEKKYSLNDIVYHIHQEDITNCETIDDVIQVIEDANENNDITDIEIIYYSNAIKYLQENDPSLSSSLGLAHDM